MNEKTLIKISIVSSIIGIILIVLSNKMFEPEIKKISEITGQENLVQIRGNITKIVISKQNTYFLKMRDDTGTLDLVIFNNSIKDVKKLKENIILNIIGKPNFYKGKLEIIVTKLIF